MKKIIFILLAFLTLAACEKKDEPGSVQLTDETMSEQTVFADETGNKVGGISFATTGAWTAEVKRVELEPELKPGSKAGESLVDWISLSQYSGDKAGNYTLTLSFRLNTTGNDRKAQITITSGMSSISITIEQKGTTEEGEVPVDKALTYDGKAPYIHFEETEILLPAYQHDPLRLAVKTNMLEPVFSIISEVETDNIIVVEHWSKPDEGNEGNCQFELAVFPNMEDRVRSTELRVLTLSEQLIGSIRLKQQPGAVCQVTGRKAEVGALSFTLKANAATAYVIYGLSDKPLQTDAEIEEFLNDRSKSKELELNGEGARDFEVGFNNLLPARTYYFYLTPMANIGEGKGVPLAEEASTTLQESKHDLILEVSANPANEFTVYLPFSDDELSGTIDWGDGKIGKVEGWNQQGASHKYTVTATTTFTVRFSGILKNMSLEADIRGARENTLLAVKQWGYTGLTKINLSGFSSLKEVATDTEGAFRGMEHFGLEPYGGSFSGTGLEKIPAGFFDHAVNATGFDYTFGDCTKLTSIPDGLFKNCTKATSFKRTFIECKSIGAIPSDLFASCTEATTFWATFAYCEALHSIPSGLFANNTKVISFEGTFSNCGNLSEIPADLFAHAPKVLYFGLNQYRDETHRGGVGVFENCVSLTSIPSDLFAGNPVAKDFSYAFKGCKALTVLPQDLFKQNAQLEQVEGTFLGCELLKSIPAPIFDTNRKLMNVDMLFSQCRQLEGESPYTNINGKKVHLYERDDYSTEFVAVDRYNRCFEGCTRLTDYEVIQTKW